MTAGARMLPPVLEIYVVWHHRDGDGRKIATEITEHFHGTVFSGLIGGAIEVYARSEGWSSFGDAPRPIPYPSAVSFPDEEKAQFIAVVPLIGNELAAAVEVPKDPWRLFVESLVRANLATPDRVGIFPFALHPLATRGTVVGELLNRFQRIADARPMREPASALRCRDLAQGITQLLLGQPPTRLTVFISHTKRGAPGEQEDVEKLIDTVRRVITGTRLQQFFDASDLQPGRDWDADLRAGAATSALLAIRTDLYPSREWCQREVLIAKRAGMPVVIADAIGRGEERGSFLMDHVPRIPVRVHDKDQIATGIRNALNLLVDECLKRELWKWQKTLAEKEDGLSIAWWAPHAPEPVTFVTWLQEAKSAGRVGKGQYIRILHPDPPLGPDEKQVLSEIALMSGVEEPLDIMTPRLLAARGG